MTARGWPWLVALGLLLLGLAGFSGSSFLIGTRADPTYVPQERSELRETFGTARTIRSDEWAVDLPLARAQQLAKPSFPLVNSGLGLGALQRGPYGTPVLDWGAAFRPLLWPVLVGRRWGLGVRWFLRDAVLLAGLFLWLRAVLENPAEEPREGERRTHLAGLAALAVLMSGALVWWRSTAIIEVVAFAGLAVGASQRLLDARGRWKRAGWLAAVFYLSACAFSGSFYPPVWAPVLWLVGATVFDARLRRSGRALAAARATVPVLAAIAGGALVAIAYYLPYLALVRDTVYPGRRVARAGEMPLDRFSTSLWPSLEARVPLHAEGGYRGTRPGGNECEASGVEVLPLYLLALLAAFEGPAREAVRRAVRATPALVAAVAVLAAWLVAPLPAWTGTVTLLRWSPWNRAWTVFGVGCALVAARLVSDVRPPSTVARRRAHRMRDAAAVAAFLGAAWLLAHRQVTSMDPRVRNAAIVLAVLTVTAAALLDRPVARWLLAAAWLVPLLLANAHVNPIVASSELMRGGAGHLAVLEAVRERPGRVVNVGGLFGAWYAGFGIPDLNAVETAPDSALYRFLADEAQGLEPAAYNRYAHVLWAQPPVPSGLVHLDVIRISISACSPRLAALWVNHFLANPDEPITGCREAFDVKPVGGRVLWSRREPVGPFGVARVEAPTSALDFDYRLGPGPRPAVTWRRDGFAVEVPAGIDRPVALAVNLGAVERVTCDGGEASALDAHLVFRRTGAGPARCEASWLGTIGAARRFLGAPPVRFESR